MSAPEHAHIRLRLDFADGRVVVTTHDTWFAAMTELERAHHPLNGWTVEGLDAVAE